MNLIFKNNNHPVNTFVDILIDNKKISNISFDETGMNSFGYENINEVFFDVFEIKSKEFDLVKEKKGEFNGFPIIEMDLTVDNQVFKNVRFVLKEQNKISINPNLLDYTTAVIQEKISKKTKKTKTKTQKTTKNKKTITENISTDIEKIKKDYKNIAGFESIEKNKNELVNSLKAEILENIKQEIQMGIISDMMKSHIQTNFNTLIEEKENTGKLSKIVENYNTTFRNEIIQLTEKMIKRESFRYVESGGGTNAVQYANGGTINGNLIINGTLSATTVTSPNGVGGGTTNKKVFDIVGDGVNQTFILSHDFNTYNVIVNVYEKATKAVVLCYIEHTTLDTVTIDVGSIIPDGQDLYTAVIIS